MAKRIENRKIQVYPSPQAARMLGADVEGEAGPSLNLAIEAFARMVAAATDTVAGRLTREDWCLLADVLNSTWVEPSISPQTQLSLSVTDGDRLDGLGAKWFGAERAVERVASLVTTLENITTAEAWAIVFAVRWFWARHGDVAVQEDEWWSLAFRTRRAE